MHLSLPGALTSSFSTVPRRRVPCIWPRTIKVPPPPPMHREDDHTVAAEPKERKTGATAKSMAPQEDTGEHAERRGERGGGGARSRRVLTAFTSTMDDPIQLVLFRLLFGACLAVHVWRLWKKSAHWFVDPPLHFSYPLGVFGGDTTLGGTVVVPKTRAGINAFFAALLASAVVFTASPLLEMLLFYRLKLDRTGAIESPPRATVLSTASATASASASTSATATASATATIQSLHSPRSLHHPLHSLVVVLSTVSTVVVAVLYTWFFLMDAAYYNNHYYLIILLLLLLIPASHRSAAALAMRARARGSARSGTGSAVPRWHLSILQVRRESVRYLFYGCICVYIPAEGEEERTMYPSL